VKVKTENVKTVTITLQGDREIELLAGLVDFPSHYSQPQEIREFLSELQEELPEASSPEHIGYKDVTNF
jgi:hypothetical protein